MLESAPPFPAVPNASPSPVESANRAHEGSIRDIVKKYLPTRELLFILTHEQPGLARAIPDYAKIIEAHSATIVAFVGSNPLRTYNSFWRAVRRASARKGKLLKYRCRSVGESALLAFPTDIPPSNVQRVLAELR